MTQEKALAVTESNLTREQVDLVKHTVAVGATDNELKLFLYQAAKRGLDPLTRQIHFIKRKRYNPDTEKYEEVGTIQTGIDGFRVIAGRTGKLSGIRRGSIYNDKGELTGAWAEVYRSDWQHPAREEVSFKEYCQTNKDGKPRGLWSSMPETMIKKVAESAALRMAFPEDLSGIYTHDEMSQADVEVAPSRIAVESTATAVEAEPVSEAPSEPLATEAQRKKIFAAAKSMGYAEDEVKEIMSVRFHVESSKDLTKSQASELIDLIERGEGLQAPEPE